LPRIPAHAWFASFGLHVLVLAAIGIGSWVIWLRRDPPAPPVIAMQAQAAVPRPSLPPPLPEVEVLPPPVSEANLVEAELAWGSPLEGESPLEMWPLPAEWVNQAEAYQLPPAPKPKFARVDPPTRPESGVVPVVPPEAFDPLDPTEPTDPTQPTDPPAASLRIDPVPDPQACPQPVYPLPAQRRGMQGVVTLLVAVDAKGRVTQVRLLESSGHGILDRAAQDAVAQWVFQPATEGGEAVPGAARVPIRFRILPND
jgi:periplasmic protein TonB